MESVNTKQDLFQKQAIRLRTDATKDKDRLQGELTQKEEDY
jgi:hypothetical protein